MAQKSPLGDHVEVCMREFDYVNSARKFGEKNPTEIGKFLLVIFLGYLL